LVQRLLATCALVLLLYGCGDNDSTVAGQDSRETIIKGGPCASCSVVAESLAFLGHPDDTVAIRHENLPAMDSRGRFYIGSGSGGAVLVFGPDGRLMRSFGKPGQGPGEFANVSEIFIGKNDTIFVLGGGVIHVVSPEYEHIRQYPNGGGGGGFSGTMLVDGRMLRERQGHKFALVDSIGELLPPVQLRDIDTTECSDCERSYREGSTPGTIWSAPQNQYRVEQHDLTGKLLQRIIREVEWFPSWFDGPGVQGNDDMIAFFTRPRLLGVRQGSDGIVWSHIMVLENAELLKGTDVEEPRGMAKVLASMITRVEGIDPARKKVVASSRFENVVFPLTGDISAQLIADASGDWAWKILRFSEKKSERR
jgi:hypothetical protein